MLQSDPREMTLKWLAASVNLVAQVPADAPSILRSNSLACKSATSMAKGSKAASERSVSRSCSVSNATSGEAFAAVNGSCCVVTFLQEVFYCVYFPT